MRWYRPRNHHEMALRIPPREQEIDALFAGWRQELDTCRKYAPSARTFTACRLITQVGLRITETCQLDLDDIKWDLGAFGKLHVRYGKGANRSGPRPRMVPLIGRFRRDAALVHRGHLGPARHRRPAAGGAAVPLERRHADRTAKRITDDGIRSGLAEATARHLPGWNGKLTPHVLRHYCASQLYLSGVGLLAIQELLGHAWVVTTMRYVHVNSSHVEDAWQAAAVRRGGTPGRTAPMIWNLRLVAANHGIWKASEMQRRLAGHGLVISAGKMSGLWSGKPASLKRTTST